MEKKKKFATVQENNFSQSAILYYAVVVFTEALAKKISKFPAILHRVRKTSFFFFFHFTHFRAGHQNFSKNVREYDRRKSAPIVNNPAVDNYARERPVADDLKII